MPYNDLREYLEELEKKGLLKRIKTEVDPDLEVAEIQDRLVRSGGPAVIFEKVKGHSMPIVANLFGTRERVATIGIESKRRRPRRDRPVHSHASEARAARG